MSRGRSVLHASRLAGVLVAATFSMTSTPSRAGNAETFYLGNDAALLAGAATAAAQGASATWYNPARVAIGAREDVDVSGTAYLLRFGGVPDFEGAPGYEATRQKLASIDLNAVPTAVALRRTILGLDVGLGLFVPTRTVAYPRTLVTTRGPPGSAPLQVAVDGNERSSEYYAGLAVGRSLRRGLHFGAALFGYYSPTVETGILGVRRGDVPMLFTAGTLDRQQVGGQFVLGVSYRVLPRVELGMTFRSPVLQLASQTQTTAFNAAATSEGATSALGFDEQPLGADPSLLAPLRAEVGAAVEVAENTTLAVDLKARGRLPANRFAGRTVPMADLRAGLRHRLRRSVWIGGGVFSDRSSTSRASITSTRLDFYGATLGAEFGTPYRIVAERGDETREVRFSTAIAFSYALGIGSVGNVVVAPAGDLLALTPARSDAIAHELMLYLGSSLGIGR